MKKRLGILLCLLVLLSSGCDTLLLSNPYRKVSNHGVERGDTVGGAARRASSYDDLKQIISGMVHSKETEGVIQFHNYSGDAKRDVYKAYHEIVREPLGVYLVEYFIPEFTEELTYTELNLSITYYAGREAPEEIVAGEAELIRFLEQGLEQRAARLVCEDNNFQYGEPELQHLLMSLYLARPEQAVCRPEITVALYYAGAGTQRILDIQMRYGEALSEMEQRADAVSTELDALMSGLPEGLDQGQTALWLHDALIAKLQAIPPADEQETGRADNIFTALTENQADAEGFALCYAALCERAGLEVRAITGMRRGVAVTWNLISIDGVWYHADVAADEEATAASSARPSLQWFRRTDEQMEETTYWSREDTKGVECITEWVPTDNGGQ